MLQDVSAVDPSTTILGKPSALPLVFAPTGFTRMMHTEGEPAVARAAERAGIPYALSTMGTTSIERLAAEAPGGRRWFQLYLWRDREAGRDFVARAAESGYEALVLTVDTPVPGPRLRDVRNGLTIPPSVTRRTVVEGARHPAWWIDLLTTEPLEFASMSHFDGTIAELVAQMFDPSATMADLDWLRSAWDGPLVVKGIQTAADARAVVDRGADAVVVSNHGGRQLDRAPTPLEVLPEVVDAVGDRAEVYVDGGIMSGRRRGRRRRARSPGGAGRSGLPVRPDGGRRARGRPGRRHPRAPRSPRRWRCSACARSPTSVATMYAGVPTEVRSATWTWSSTRRAASSTPSPSAARLPRCGSSPEPPCDCGPTTRSAASCAASTTSPARRSTCAT